MLSKIIPEKCIACGLCQIYAPTVFDYEDNGIVLFKRHPESVEEFIVNEEEAKQVVLAYRKCPVHAIEINKLT